MQPLLHGDPRNRGATFQVASQFNLLGMVSPDVGPEAGVSRYEKDLTQGPACAIACGAGTIFRNYFVEVGGAIGQTTTRQIDCLAQLGGHLFEDRDPPWTMRNGYALFTEMGLVRINNRLRDLDDTGMDAARSQLRVGVHRDVGVTLSGEGHAVTQAFCSALPVAYNVSTSASFEPLARLVLDATYEATMRAAVLNASRTGSRNLYLTLVGGGVFGNRLSWIIAAIDREFCAVADSGLDVAIVSFTTSNPVVGEVVDRLSR